MTTHLDEELLAQWVIDGEAPDGAAAVHLRSCARCQTSLAELETVAEQLNGSARLERAPADVWDRISTELGFESRGPDPTALVETDHRSDHEASGDASDSMRPHALERKRWLSRPLLIAASSAAVLGLGAGIGGTLLLTSGDSQQPKTEAIARLEPLAGKSGAGKADLLQDPAGSQLRITATGLTRTPGFYEVWLINSDGKRMVSLGVLDPSIGGTFQVPSNITSQGYRIVDISLEPNDGNPEHSHNSVVRGTLPG